MYGKRLQDRSLYGSSEKVTHLRDATGRAVHVVNWTAEEIAKWKRENGQCVVTSVDVNKRKSDNLILAFVLLLLLFSFIGLLALIQLI